jgi:2-polyprenyl-3-methyl-5-hydroxy-6-metoxy-1,4-benzoquinol methylase
MMPPPTPSISACPVCSSPKIERFDCFKDSAGDVTDILKCRECDALVNHQAYARVEELGIDAMQRSDVYALSADDLAEVGHMLDDAQQRVGFLNTVFGVEDSHWRDKVFCDFGAGRGFIAIDAAKRFRKSIVCEMDQRHIAAVLETLPTRPCNLEMITDIGDASEPISVLHLWHTLEHLPQPTEFWLRHKDKLAPDALIFLQIPLYRPAHIGSWHYVFYTERSLSCWASLLGFEPVEFCYDLDLGFLAMVATRKLRAPGEEADGPLT